MGNPSSNTGASAAPMASCESGVSVVGAAIVVSVLVALTSRDVRRLERKVDLPELVDA